MIVLGIETSCDETAVGIVDGDRNILANVLYSQIKEHLAHGGVVPEIAARAHVQVLDPLIRAALEQAELELCEVDAIAATCGPGLIGGVMVGMMTAKAMAAATKKPFLAINHLEAHVLTARLTNNVPFPYLTLLVSGGHTQLLIAHDVNDYTLLGESIDDAVGEAFDKSAKLMGLPYPGGPIIERLAKDCTADATTRYPLPRPLLGQKGCDFSFSGLKTAMRQTIEKLPPGPLATQTMSDVCAALQSAIADILCDRVNHALPAAVAAGCKHFVLAGGVAANQFLRDQLKGTVALHGLALEAPPIKLCTDNGVMVAWAGIEHLRRGDIAQLNVAARPRWPLMELKERTTA